MSSSPETSDVVSSPAPDGPAESEGDAGRVPGRDRADTHEDERSWWKGAILFGAPVVAAAAGGSLAGPARTGTDDWFRSLRKPPFQPPDAIFGPVWTTLYPMIAAAGWRVWRRPDSEARTRALRWWWAQMAANAAWTPLFFGARRPRAALAVLAGVVGSSLGFARAARSVDAPAVALFGPYLGWVGFAAALNEEIVRRNPEA